MSFRKAPEENATVDGWFDAVIAEDRALLSQGGVWGYANSELNYCYRRVAA